jgi:Putative auto-transporter adhesin, head GIN domain
MFRKIAVLPALLVLAACNWSECGDCMTSGGKGPRIEGSGTMKTETRPVETFTAITLSGIESSLLVIERTGEETLSVTAEDNLLPLFTSTVKDGTLRLSFAKGNSFHGKRPTYRITVNELHALNIQGGAAI